MTVQRKKLTIGLFGFGCVGYGLFEVLAKNPETGAAIKKICVKDAKKARPISQENFTFDKAILLNDPEINLIIELIDDTKAAFEIVTTALKKGIPVISANKKMIAENFRELVDLQRKYKTPLLYEAACCASIPIIRNLEDYFNSSHFNSLEGIVNGSTNFILTKIFSDNVTYQQSLAEAKAKGYVESDPTLDTGGFDAKYKLLILNAHAFGIISDPAEIFNTGISHLGDFELSYARDKNYKIKLTANTFKTTSGEITTFVMPKFVTESELLYSIDNEFNGLIINPGFAGKQFFAGKGAGAHPTASAVLSDISALALNYKYQYEKLNQPETSLNEDLLLKIMFRISDADMNNPESFFTTIINEYTSGPGNYIIGYITLKKLRSLCENYDTKSVILFEVCEQESFEHKIVNSDLSLIK